MYFLRSISSGVSSGPSSSQGAIPAINLPNASKLLRDSTGMIYQFASTQSR